MGMTRIYNIPPVTPFAPPTPQELDLWVSGDYSIVDNIANETSASALRKFATQKSGTIYNDLAILLGFSRNTLVRSGKFSLCRHLTASNVRGLLINRLDMTAPMFMDLVNDPEDNNRMSLACRPELPLPAQLILANDASTIVVLAVSRNGYLSEYARTLANLRLPDLLAADSFVD